MTKLQKFFIVLSFFALSSVSLSFASDNFGTTQQTVIAQKGVQAILQLEATESPIEKLSDVVASTPAQGTADDQLKKYLTTKVPAGKRVKIMVLISTQAIEDAN